VGALLGDVLPIALGIAASPFPIIPAILLLFTPRARATSSSFLLGWVVGILVATGAFALLAEVLDTRDQPATWASWARIVLGAVLVVLGVRQWLGRRAKESTPQWMQSLADATPGAALRLGLVLSAANPKILLLAAAGGLAIGSSDLAAGGVVLAVALFTVVASSTVAIPVLLYLVLGERILGPLGAVRDWLQANNAAVMAVVIVVIGVLLLVKGLGGL
jgi:threonine/homoserine/homoserine lactone efflux protein